MSKDPTHKIITTVIDGFVKNEKMFSAFDVTTKIRGMGVYCKHDAVKVDIHSAMKDIMNEGSEDYERTLVSTGNYRTYVYHKSTVDPHTYNQKADDTVATPVVADTASSPAVAVGPKTIAPKPVSKIVGASMTASRDGRGRICVPADMLRSIGAVAGKKVVISPMTGEVIVDMYNPNQSTVKSSHVYKVDRDNNVRISAGVFAKANLGTFNSFNILQDNDKIKVY